MSATEGLRCLGGLAGTVFRGLCRTRRRCFVAVASLVFRLGFVSSRTSGISVIGVGMAGRKSGNPEEPIRSPVLSVRPTCLAA